MAIQLPFIKVRLPQEIYTTLLNSDVGILRGKT